MHQALGDGAVEEPALVHRFVWGPEPKGSRGKRRLDVRRLPTKCSFGPFMPEKLSEFVRPINEKKVI